MKIPTKKSYYKKKKGILRQSYYYPIFPCRIHNSKSRLDIRKNPKILVISLVGTYPNSTYPHRVSRFVPDILILPILGTFQNDVF